VPFISLSLLAFLLAVHPALSPLTAAADPAVLRVDFSKALGAIRPLHGVNKGPLGPGGLIDLRPDLAPLSIPLTRLHDCYFPNPYVVDIHAVFPDFSADPSLPQSYDFRLTDEYISAVRDTGAQIVYRLGESIEHTSIKRFVHPPSDPAKWAAICLGIIRHFNEGWAAGHRWGIRYWEIWNEPENRPAMWSGTDEDYFKLYQTAATAIKNAFPHLLVGGPAVGASGQFVNGSFQPTGFVADFLRRCRSASLPLDFFSWHCYTADPLELVQRAHAIRRLLDAHGFSKSESHLNEWNYLPGNTWAPLSPKSPATAREKFYLEMAGAPGAAFITSALLRLQDAPLDAANLFHGELGAFGLFNEFGVPQKNYHALRAFSRLLQTPRRVSASSSAPQAVPVLAGLNSENTRAAVLLCGSSSEITQVRLDFHPFSWPGGTAAQIFLLDDSRNLDLSQTTHLPAENPSLTLHLRPPFTALIELSAPSGKP